MTYAILQAPAASRVPEAVPGDGEISTAGFAAETGGEFAAGEGYVSRGSDFIQDEQRRECRGAWQIQTRCTGSERLLKIRMAVGAWRNFPAGTGSHLRRRHVRGSTG